MKSRLQNIMLIFMVYLAIGIPYLKSKANLDDYCTEEEK